jgi:hypothetical protein
MQYIGHVNNIHSNFYTFLNIFRTFYETVNIALF